MSLDEITYVAVLAGSIPVGLCLKYTGSLTREVGASVIGFCIVAATCGVHAVHSAVCVLVTWAITHFCIRHCYNLTLAWMFGYLLFFRLLVVFDLARPSPFTNAVQLLLTLKMVSLAAEVTPVMKEIPPKTPTDAAPSLRKILCYSYCYMGIITGPFYRFRTHQDWVGERDMKEIPSLGPLIHRLRWTPLYGAAFLGASYFFPLSLAQSPEFTSAGFPYILLYTAAIFFVFRMRFYTAWTFSEATCMAAGLGAYPVSSRAKPGLGPTIRAEQTSGPKIYTYETIRNINPYKTDFCESVKDGMRNWNMTVQWWLANYIYRRAPFHTRMLRIGWTMLVSAFWHGVHPGYYLSFLTIPLCLAAEGVMDTGVRGRLGERAKRVYDLVHWFWALRAYDYMCVGFVFLGWRETLAFWGHLYFYQHLLCCVLFVLGYLLTPPYTRTHPDRKSALPSHLQPPPRSPPLPHSPTADDMDLLQLPPSPHQHSRRQSKSSTFSLSPPPSPRPSKMSFFSLRPSRISVPRPTKHSASPTDSITPPSSPYPSSAFLSSTSLSAPPSAPHPSSASLSVPPTDSQTSTTSTKKK